MTKTTIKPPNIAQRILRLFVRYDEEYDFYFTLLELYEYNLGIYGRSRANRWYWRQVLLSIPKHLFMKFIWSLIMFRNITKIAFRNMLKHKGYTAINAAGLSVGVACCLLITIWAFNEYQYNNFHTHSKSLFGVVKSREFDGKRSFVNSTPVPLALSFKEKLPDVADATRYKGAGRALFSYSDKVFYESRVYYVDASFLKMFTFNALQGERHSALDDPFSIALTQEAAEKYFGSENPVGKSIIFNNEYNLTVRCILENPPQNSSLQFRILIPYSLREIIDKKEGYVPTWLHNDPLTYILLDENIDQKTAEANIKTFVQASARTDLIAALDQMESGQTKDIVSEMAKGELKLEFTLVPMNEIRFSPFYGGGNRVQFLSIFATVAVFVLLIACVNFINLTTARAVHRAKEIGLRKVIGANRKTLVYQFLGESLLMSFIALFIAETITIYILPYFNELFLNNIPVNLIWKSEVIILFLGVAVFTGLIAGSYPAFVLSAYKPVSTLSGKVSKGKSGSKMRKSLVIFQFVLSVLFIIGTVVVFKQINYMLNKDLGYDKDHVVCIPLNSGSIQYYDLLKDILSRDSRVLNITGIHQRPSRITSTTSFIDWDGKSQDEEIRVGNFRVNYDYVKTMKIELIAGRDFSKEIASDKKMGFVVNEELIRIMDITAEEAVGRRFMFGGDDGTIIGVVRDFHFLKLERGMRPMVMHIMPERSRYLVIRIAPFDIPATVDYIKDTWSEIATGFPFEYSFLDSDFEALYRGEVRLGNMMKSFAFMAIAIAFLGIFGLASYTAEQKTKEIGIRKTLGASTGSIVNLFIKDFIILVVISNLISWPLAYYLMSKWLQTYAYRTDMGLLIFIVPTLIAIIVTILTVGFQALKAANKDPVNALKYE